MSEESNANGTQQDGEGVGAALRKARIEADVDVNKVCSDLRISPQALEALEQGNYHLLPGDPYIRALLGSLGRYLGLDSQALVQRYNSEIGAVHAAPSIAPYKDRTQTHTASHKQIFIVIFGVLIVILVAIIYQLKKHEPAAAGLPPAPGAASGPSDSLPGQSDTLVSNSLAPDSGATRSSPDSGDNRGLGAPKSAHEAGKAAPRADSAAAKTAAPVQPAPHAPAPGAQAPVTAPAASPAGAPAGTAPAGPPGAASVPPAPGPAVSVPGAAASAASTAGLNSAIVKPLIDSVGVRVVRSGKEDFSTLLRLGKQMQVSHTDTIVVMVSKRKSVEVTVEGKTVIPERKRFKIFGTTVKTF